MKLALFKKPQIKYRVEIIHPSKKRIPVYTTLDENGKFFRIDNNDYDFDADCVYYVGNKNEPTLAYHYGKPNALPIARIIPDLNKKELDQVLIKLGIVDEFGRVSVGVKARSASDNQKARKNDVVTKLYAAAMESSLDKWLKMAAIGAIVAAACGVLNLLIGIGGIST